MTPRMDGAELRCRREYLGLSSEDLAGLLRNKQGRPFNSRTVRSWEEGRYPISSDADIPGQLARLEDEFEREVDKTVATYAGTNNRVILVATDSGTDPEGYPHRWGRHVAARVRRLVPGIVIRTAE